MPVRKYYYNYGETCKKILDGSTARAKGIFKLEGSGGFLLLQISILNYYIQYMA